MRNKKLIKVLLCLIILMLAFGFMKVSTDDTEVTECIREGHTIYYCEEYIDND